MNCVYLLLSRSGTAFSRLIRALTGDEYTHVSLGLGAGGEIYSFARLHPRRPLPAGLVREDIAKGYMARHPDIPCAVYRLEVTREQYDAIRRRVNAMLLQHERYHYSILGTALCRLDIAHERGYHFFCSQFVGDVPSRSGAAELPKAASLMRPEDFTQLPDAELIYKGPISGAPCVRNIFHRGEDYAVSQSARAV